MKNILYGLNKLIGDKSFLIGGQLLGAVRESGFIKDEHDIDLGILAEDYDEVFKIVKENFLLEDISVRTIDETGIKRCIKFEIGGINVDIFLFHLVGDCRYEITNCDSFAFHKYPKELFENLGKIEFFGKEYNIPNPPEAFLQLEYGDDWLTPRGNWSCCYDPPCVLSNRDEIVEVIKGIRK